jgi:hypothetical protein
MKANLKEINLKYDELAEENIVNTSNVLLSKNIVTLEKIEGKLIIDKALKELEEGRGILYDRVVVDVCIKTFREKKFKF